jgi:hypothetical protein
MTYLHSSQEQLLCLPINITEHVILSYLQHIRQRGAKQKTEQ